jgi:ribosomal protein S12 methylthiotransferase accessory factor YcaO
VSFADIPDLSTSTISGDIHVLCERLAAAGMRRIFLARLDPPEVGFPVVRAVVPGLELVHGTARLVGPRLARHLAANGGRETC